ncbi:MAG: hypothetical protein KGH55_01960 [Nanoarchaeota archaeon]|nr:hypothetical protein [Nanoarchaeota archaeon]
MNIEIKVGDFNSFLGSFYLSYEYGRKMRKLSVGESMVIRGFKNKYKLLTFVDGIIGTGDSDKNYSYHMDEKDLTCTIERLD